MHLLPSHTMAWRTNAAGRVFTMLHFLAPFYRRALSAELAGGWVGRFSVVSAVYYVLRSIMDSTVKATTSFLPLMLSPFCRI